MPSAIKVLSLLFNSLDCNLLWEDFVEFILFRLFPPVGHMRRWRVPDNPFVFMRDTFPLLVKTDFPPIRRGRLETLQANLGYRSNLTILNEQGQEDLAGFLAVNDVEIVASLPCYLEENVDGQHGTRLARQCQPGQLRLSIGRGDATDSLKKLAGPPPEFLAP